VRFATLATNSHDTQPWLFTFGETRITIAPDFSRRCPAVDPDDHHLFASLGCTTENLVQAASARGWRATPVFDGERIVIELETAHPVNPPWLDASTARQRSRTLYHGKEVPAQMARQLEEAAGGDGGLRPYDDGQGPAVAYRRLRVAKKFCADARWRFHAGAHRLDPLQRGQCARHDGWPVLRIVRQSVLAVMDRAAPAAAVLHGAWREREVSHADRKFGRLAIIVSEMNERAHWVAAGRACQRFGFSATALGLKYAFINQPFEVADLRAQFASYLGLGGRRPDMVMRFGWGPELPKSLRRPPDQVIRTVS
jgi:hypothetical protein